MLGLELRSKRMGFVHPAAVWESLNLIKSEGGHEWKNFIVRIVKVQLSGKRFAEIVG
jgi:hypothetical protein